MVTCPYCGCDPFEWVDVGIGMVAVAVTCCEWGIAYFQYGKTPHQIHKMTREQKREDRKYWHVDDEIDF